ncbi:MAG: DJ-1/PfpI family protein [Pseudomonadota bacterium]
MLTVAIVVFPQFETLDALGPVEMFGMHRDQFEIRMVAEARGPVASTHGPEVVAADAFQDGRSYDIVLVPGGPGTRAQNDNAIMMDWLREQATQAQFVTSVCTGSALLAKAGVLDGRRATSNKRAFDWVMTHSDKVDWIYEARWVEDGKFWTSSGVSAGMDMSLALIAKILGKQAAEDAAMWAEYTWHRDPNVDPFAVPREAEDA